MANTAKRRLSMMVIAVGVLFSFGLAGTAATAAPAADGVAAAAASAQTAQSIVLRRTGGLIGVDDTFTVLAGNPSPRAPQLFELVGSDAFLALAPVYGPSNPCCDVFSYRLTVRYTDGTTKSVFTSDLAFTAPAILRQVIALTASIGATTGLPQS